MKPLPSLALMLASIVVLHAAGFTSPLKGPLADYDSELRRADGRVDTEVMVRRLQELGVGTYYWLVWHAATEFRKGPR